MAYRFKPEKKIIKAPYGPVSFGWVLSGGVVSWSADDAKDLFVSRCWDGVYLYKTRDLSDEELARPPVRVTDKLGWMTMATVMDWNRDGIDDLIISDGFGFLYLFERCDRGDSIYFENRGLIRDCEHGLPVLLSFTNPEYPKMHDLFGYQDSIFSGYPMPAAYVKNGSRDLIVGGWGGSLLWLKDETPAERFPSYRGHKCDLGRDEIVSPRGRRILAEKGTQFAIPDVCICDEAGRPFLLGDGYDAGNIYRGGVTRPLVYGDDLLVLAGTHKMEIFHLTPSGLRVDGCPIFKNSGTVDTGDIFQPYKLHYVHSKLIAIDKAGDLLIPLVDKLAVVRRMGDSAHKLKFAPERLISGSNVTTSGNNFTVILNNERLGKKYLLDNCTDNTFEIRELINTDGEIMLSSNAMKITGPNGIFRVEGVTDPQGGKDFYGFNRTFFWDHDGTCAQNLIVGTDKGLFYLLKVTETSDPAAPFDFLPVGPLKSSGGNELKVYNRSCACGIDFDGNGREDLIVCGISYQMGMLHEPVPGGGVFRIINLGTDAAGDPVLSEILPVRLSGIELDIRTNTHIHMQALDIDGDGRKELIIANQGDGFRGHIFKIDVESKSLVYTNEYIEKISIEENLLDINGDGLPELVFGGGESGIAYYWEI